MSIFACTDKGCYRNNNEDAYFVSSEPVGIFDELMIVSDGMGGHQAGEVASEICVTVLRDSIRSYENSSPRFVLEQALSEANLTVLQEAEKRNIRGMGTTAVIAAVLGDRVFCANLGDSRFYVINTEERSIRQVTKDHSLVEEQVRLGLIRRGSPEYNARKNVITRAVGIYSEVDPDLFELEITEKDILLLCSDGLNNLVNDEEILDIVTDHGCSKETVDILIEKAKEYGGLDNITVVLRKGEAAV